VTRRKDFLAAFASLVFLALMLVNTAPAAESQTLTKVRVAVATPQLGPQYPFATLPIAMGWFRQEGLDVSVVPGTASQTTVQLLLAGQADLGVIVPETGIIARAQQDAPIRSVYPLARLSYTFAVAADSSIRTVADLEGKRIGHISLGGGTVPYAAQRFAEAGFGASDVQSIAVGFGPQVGEALKGGRVDALVGFTSLWSILRSSGYQFRLLPEASWQRTMYGYNYYATDSYTKANQDVIARFGRAVTKAIIFAKTNPEAVVRIFWKQFPASAPADPNDAAALARDIGSLRGQLADMNAFSRKLSYPWGYQDRGKWDSMQQYMQRSGQLTKTVPASALFMRPLIQKWHNFEKQRIVQRARNWK